MDKAVCGAVGKRFDKKMTGNFDVDLRCVGVFIELTKILCFGNPRVKFPPL